MALSAPTALNACGYSFCDWHSESVQPAAAGKLSKQPPLQHKRSPQGHGYNESLIHRNRLMMHG